jgi:hypothetical protein
MVPQPAPAMAACCCSYSCQPAPTVAAHDACAWRTVGCSAEGAARLLLVCSHCRALLRRQLLLRTQDCWGALLVSTGSFSAYALQHLCIRCCTASQEPRLALPWWGLAVPYICHKHLCISHSPAQLYATAPGGVLHFVIAQPDLSLTVLDALCISAILWLTL